MCWSPEASAAIVAVGAVATVMTRHRGEAPAIWGTLGYFTAMEVLQLAGYGVLDECGTSANRSVTLLSYLHIAFQPIVINLFALQLVPPTIRKRAYYWVLSLAAMASAVMLLQLMPIDEFGYCLPGTPLCGAEFCTVSGTWHIAWNIPYNGLLVPFENLIGNHSGFPTYMAAVFLLPLAYGAWRFVLMHVFAGPVLAWTLTDNPNEMPAIWCLFSIAILLIAISSTVRNVVTTESWWGVKRGRGV